MSRFGLEKCRDCGRLNIHGAKCVCVHPEQIDCDCRFDGNEQIIGPKCNQRIRDVWFKAIGR